MRSFFGIYFVMTGVHALHVLIGIGEAVITTLAVGAVLASRPDLVHGARDVEPAMLTGAVAA